MKQSQFLRLILSGITKWRTMNIHECFILHMVFKIPNWAFKWHNLSQWSANMIKIVLHSSVVAEYIHSLFNQL